MTRSPVRSGSAPCGRSSWPLGGLSRSYLFEDLTLEDLEPLADVVTTRQLVRGETVCRVGDPAHEILVILSGELTFLNSKAQEWLSSIGRDFIYNL